jgi:sugar phosphate isomerase/epimerase
MTDEAPPMISLAHPTLNDLSPPEFIRIAKRTGYDAINFRIIPFEPNAGSASIFNDEALFRATVAALKDSGLIALDVEVIKIEADTRAADFRPLFEAGARLGARYAVAIAMDSDESRVTHIFGELCAEAAQFGLRMVLEFMMRGGIRTLDATYRIVTAAGHPRGGILIDALHFYRSGATPSDLDWIDADLLPYMQINDVEHFEALRTATPAENAVWKKVLPGTGDLQLSALLNALPAGIPISIEVPGTPGIPLDEAERYALRALEATRAVLGAVVS